VAKAESRLTADETRQRPGASSSTIPGAQAVSRRIVSSTSRPAVVLAEIGRRKPAATALARVSGSSCAVMKMTGACRMSVAASVWRQLDARHAAELNVEDHAVELRAACKSARKASAEER
jgi:hypothetical protein